MSLVSVVSTIKCLDSTQLVKNSLKGSWSYWINNITMEYHVFQACIGSPRGFILCIWVQNEWWWSVFCYYTWFVAQEKLCVPLTNGTVLHCSMKCQLRMVNHCMTGSTLCGPPWNPHSSAKNCSSSDKCRLNWTEYVHWWRGVIICLRMSRYSNIWLMVYLFNPLITTAIVLDPIQNS